MLLVPIFSIYRNVLPPHTTALRTPACPLSSHPPARPCRPRSIRLPSHPIGSTFPMAINNFETAATFRGKNKFSRLLDWKKTTLSSLGLALFSASIDTTGVPPRPRSRATARVRVRVPLPPSDRLCVTSPNPSQTRTHGPRDLLVSRLPAVPRSMLSPPHTSPSHSLRTSSLLSSPSVLPASGHRS